MLRPFVEKKHLLILVAVRALYCTVLYCTVPYKAVSDRKSLAIARTAAASSIFLLCPLFSFPSSSLHLGHSQNVCVVGVRLKKV